MSQYILFLTIFLTLAGRFVIFRYLMRRKGFDPSLITVADPLSYRTFLGYRLAFAAGYLVWLANLNFWSHLIFWTLIVSSTLQLLIVMLFGRQHTQPVSYYLCETLAAGILLFYGNSKLALFVIAVQELLLFRWNKTRQKCYDRWVQRLASKIDRRYKRELPGISQSHWRWIVHTAVTESIARPAIVRLAERLYYRLKKPAAISTGIMQIRADKPITDIESLRRGSVIITGILASMPKGLSRHQQLTWLAHNYNGSGSYARYLQATDSGVTQFFNSSIPGGRWRARRK